MEKYTVGIFSKISEWISCKRVELEVHEVLIQGLMVGSIRAEWILGPHIKE